MKLKSLGSEALLALLWAADMMTRPTLFNLLRSYESWEQQHLIRHQFRRLEQKKLVERDRRAEQLVYHLTDAGQLAALGGRDPMVRWARPWDGKWRQVMFDLPVNQRGLRQRLLRWLRQNYFGYLQDSLWICPDPVTDVAETLEDFRDDVESFILMEARASLRDSDAAIVKGAWKFEEVNQRYEEYLELITKERRRLSPAKTLSHETVGWMQREGVAWEHAVSMDPLLPRPLLPAGYLGETAWQARRAALGQVAKQLAG